MVQSGKLNSTQHWRYLALEHKAAYRRNLLWSEITVLTAAICIGVANFLWPQNETELASITLYDNLFKAGDSANHKVAEKRPAMNNFLTATESRENSSCVWLERTGYIPNLRIIRDAPGVQTHNRNFAQDAVSSQTFDAVFDAELLLTESENDPLTASTVGYDGDQEFGRIDATWGQSGNGNSQGFGNNDIAFDREVKGAILLYPIDWPTIAGASETGVVVVDLLIDSRGRIEWTLVVEQPQGRGFANAVVEALKRSRYIPPKLDGVTVESQVQLVTQLCLSCSPDIQVTGGNLTASLMSSVSR
jgi:Gram-negative bacterial TonB protein C-terminal